MRSLLLYFFASTATALLPSSINNFSSGRHAVLPLRMRHKPSALLAFGGGVGGEIDMTMVISTETFDPVETNGILDTLLHNPTVWSSIILASIVALLWVYEELVHKLKHDILPDKLLPVLNKVLSEVAGLGFIGLFLQTILPAGGENWLSAISEKYLGESDLILEDFEFLHSTVFEVGVLFFIVNGFILSLVTDEIKTFAKSAGLADADGDGDITVEEFLAVFGKEARALEHHERNGWSVLTEIQKGEPERLAEAFLFQRRLVDQLGQPIKAENYFEEVMARNLKQLVSLSPLVWLPLLPIIALGDAVDLSRGIISASSANSAVASGAFLSTPMFLVPCLFLESVLLVWGIINFWKMGSVTSLLRPRIDFNGPIPHYKPPLFYDAASRKTWSDSPFNSLVFFESLWSAPSSNAHEELFGRTGAKGPKFYLSSIKFHTWFCVALSLFEFEEIVGLDFRVLSENGIGAQNGVVVSECAVFASLVLLKVALLSLTPTTFLKHSLATSVEFLKADWAVDKVLNELRMQTSLQHFQDSTLLPVRNRSKSNGRVVRVEDFSPSEMAEFQASFRMFDIDGSGTITAKELKTVFSSMGQSLTDDDINDIMSASDIDGNGEMDFMEFVQMMARYESSEVL